MAQKMYSSVCTGALPQLSETELPDVDAGALVGGCTANTVVGEYAQIDTNTVKSLGICETPRNKSLNDM